MANIQQSINQLLYQSQIGTGFFVNSPQVKEWKETKNLSKQYTKQQAGVAELERAGGEDIEDLKYLLGQQKDLAKTTEQLTKRGATYGGLHYPEIYESFYAQQGIEETKARLAEKIQEREQREAFRKMILEGTPAQFEEEKGGSK